MVALLARVTNRALAESIVGDLIEERERRHARSPVRARIWYWSAAMTLVGNLVRQRFTAAIRVAGWRSAFGGGGGGRELRQALRSLRRTPWYSLTVIGVIALSMTLATTVFAIVDGVLFKPLPYPKAHELYRISGGYSREVVLQAGETRVQGSGFGISARDVADLVATAPEASFTMFGGGVSGRSLGDLRVWAPSVAQIDAEFFRVFGLSPLLGGFSAEDFETPPGPVRPALISYRTWQAQFGGRVDVIGQTLSPGSDALVRYRVAGVLARDFLFPVGNEQPNVLVPLVLSSVQRTDRTQRDYGAFARLPPIVPLADYQARFNRVGRAGRAEIPDRRLNRGLGPWDVWHAAPLADSMGASRRQTFATVFVAAAVVVLLGCLNVSGLMAGRSLDRARELALRCALGASRRHIVRLVLAESVVLVTAGSLIGLAASAPFTAMVVRLLPSQLGLLKDTVIDWRVPVFVTLASAVSVVIVALWPLRRSLQVRPAGTMDAGGRATQRSTGRFIVVALQVAVSLVLTLGGVMVVSSLVRVWRTEIGFEATNLLVADGTLSAPSPEARTTALLQFVDGLRGIPGVEAAGATSATMLRGGSPGGEFRADTYRISRGFLDALQPTLINGRLTTDRELDAKVPLAVVSETFAARYFPGQPPVGRSITTPNGQQTFTVIGLVADARYAAWDSRGLQGGQFYAPLETASRFSAVVRVSPGTRSVVNPLIQVATLNPSVRLSRAAWADDLLDETIRQRRFQAWLFGSFAVAALSIVGVGVLGLVAMATARRTREVGVRVALGSTRPRLVGLLLFEQSAPVLAGLAVGGATSIWTVQLVRSYLYETTVYDASVWAAAVAAILGVTACAILIPALRASRVDPVRALRVE
jgi:predicted permease